MAVENNNEQVNEEVTNIDEGQAKANSTDESLKTDEPKEVDSKHIPYDRFKAKVDEANALKEKLAEIEKANEEAERSEEHTSELQSRGHLVCRLLLEKKKKYRTARR